MPDRIVTRVALADPRLSHGGVLITWPLVPHLTTHAAGAGYGDSYEVIRHAWWTREALMDGHNPFDQPLLVFPQGFNSRLQWTHPFQYVYPALLALVSVP